MYSELSKRICSFTCFCHADNVHIYKYTSNAPLKYFLFRNIKSIQCSPWAWVFLLWQQIALNCAEVSWREFPALLAGWCDLMSPPSLRREQITAFSRLTYQIRDAGVWRVLLAWEMGCVWSSSFHRLSQGSLKNPEPDFLCKWLYRAGRKSCDLGQKRNTISAPRITHVLALRIGGG